MKGVQLENLRLRALAGENVDLPDWLEELDLRGLPENQRTAAICLWAKVRLSRGAAPEVCLAVRAWLALGGVSSANAEEKRYLQGVAGRDVCPRNETANHCQPPSCRIAHTYENILQNVLSRPHRPRPRQRFAKCSLPVPIGSWRATGQPAVSARQRSDRRDETSCPRRETVSGARVG